tara:strand:- start:217 stop:3165 length:2949 start_codon:yes stop_codon:yes gene_type:complete
MTTYTYTKDGTTYGIRSDTQPTEQDFLDLISKQEKPLTEENIVTNPDWIAASKSVYEFNEGPNAPGLGSDLEYANYGLSYMGFFNYNLPKMAYEATQLTYATDQQKKDFVKLMDMYDAKEASFAGFGRALGGLILDPSTYVGIGTFGAGTAGAQAVKLGIKTGIKEATKAGLKQGAKVGAIEGSLYAVADNAGRQSARITAGQQDGWDFGQTATSATIGAGVGSAFGGTIGSWGARRASKKFQEKLAVEEAKPSIIDTETTFEQARKQLNPKINVFNRELAEDIRDEVNAVKEDFQADFDLELNQQAIDIGIDILDTLQIPRNPNIKISDQLFDVIQMIPNVPRYKEVFVDILRRNNINENQFAQLFKLGASDAGRRLAQFSVAKASLKNVGEELFNIEPKEGMTSGLLRAFKDTAYKLDNIRRGLLVSQIATTMRNFTAQIGRVGMHTLTKTMDSALNATFNPMRRLFGVDEQPTDYTSSFGLLLNLTSNKKFAKEATEFATKYFVNEKDRLFNNYASEVADASQSKTFRGAQKIVDGLNFLNRMQEFYYRRGMFAASLEKTLNKKGISLKEVIETNNGNVISKADVEKAVDDALEFTYAKTPDSKLGKAFVDLANSIPFITTGVVPFARFMTNAMKFQFQYSPFGPLALLTRKERAKVAEGDMGIFSKSIIGSAVLMGAIEAKRKGYGGEKWYEMKGSDGTTIDMRPYFPLTPYLLVADIILRLEQDRPLPDATDVMQGLTGAQFRTGAFLGFVNNLMDDLEGIDNEPKINRYISDFASDVLGGYLTPLRMFNDFVDQDQEFRTTVPTGEILPDITNELLRNVPFVREQFPEVESPTRADAPGRPETVRIPGTEIEVPGPLARQLSGITVIEPKNLAEKEFDRLGFRRRDILPYSGDRTADQILARYMGPVVENVISTLVASPNYERLNNPTKEIILREALKQIRAETLDFAEAEDPERFAEVRYKRLNKSIRKLIESIE